jgi:hypothetical protein
MEKRMKALIAATALATLFAMPLYAQTDDDNGADEETVTITAEEANAAAATISSIGEDQAKLDGYCAIMKEMEAAPEDDEAKAEELGGKMDQYLAGLGEDVADAFAAADSVDPESAEGQTIEEAFEELSEKCGA